MSLDWLVDPWARSDVSRSSLPTEVPSRSYNNVLKGGMDVALSFPKACDDVLLGTPGVSLDLFSSNRRTESSNSDISRDSLTPTTFYVSKRCMERTSIFRLFRCWLRDFGSLVPLFLVTRMQEDRPYASTRTFFLKRRL